MRHGEASVALALEGIKILHLTRLIPGAVCTSIHGDAASEVIKIEEIGVGDYERQIPPFIRPMTSRFHILRQMLKIIEIQTFLQLHIRIQ